MARRSNYGFEKRQKEKLKAEKAAKKRERKLERKEAVESGEVPEDDMIAPIDPADLGLDHGAGPPAGEVESDDEDR